MCRYLDDWLLLASSRPLVLRALETVLQLCQELGIVVNWEDSSLTSAQRVVYLGVILVSTLFRASSSQPRVEKLCSTVKEFLSCDRQPASLWRRLVGILSSVTVIIPGGRLRMRSLQFCLHLLWIGRFLHDSSESGVSPGPGMVDRGGSSSVRHFSGSGQPSPRLLVRLLRHGVGSSSSGCHRFRPLASGGNSSVDQRQGVACGGVRSSRIPTPSVQLYGGSLCGQFHSSSLSPQTRGHKVSTPQLYCAEDSSLHWQVWRFSCLDPWVV